MSNESQDNQLANVCPLDSLWLLIPQLLASIVISSLIIIAVFRVYFGEFSVFSFGFTLFLSVMQVLMVIGYRFQNRVEYHTTKEASLGLLDKIGGFWLVACAFGAFFSWVFGQLAAAFPEISSSMYFAAAVFAIGLPVVTVLPNLRYVGGKAALIQVPLLVMITILPVLEGAFYLGKIYPRLFY
jgi:hypothetical protein